MDLKSDPYFLVPVWIDIRSVTPVGLGVGEEMNIASVLPIIISENEF